MVKDSYVGGGGDFDATSAHENYLSLTNPVQIQKLLEEYVGRRDNYAKQIGCTTNERQRASYETLYRTSCVRIGELERRLAELSQK